MRLALFQPDIAQNTGTILRMAACFAVAVEIVEPCGFPFDDRRFRRAGMDYVDHARLRRHTSWNAFQAARADGSVAGRLVLLSTAAATPHVDFAFRPDDILMLGQESAGAPAEIHAIADARVRIPMAAGLRSLNVAVAAAVVLGEALRQTGSFPAS